MKTTLHKAHVVCCLVSANEAFLSVVRDTSGMAQDYVAQPGSGTVGSSPVAAAC